MRAAGIDYGSVRVGVAVADELGILAHPRPHLDARRTGPLFEALGRLAREEQVELFVVGLPRSLSGAEGPAARRARRFAQELGARTAIPVELWDERLTTVEAHARLRAQGVRAKEARARVDSAAAAVLLQSWLEARRRA